MSGDLINRSMVMDYLRQRHAGAIINRYHAEPDMEKVYGGIETEVNNFINFIVQAPADYNANMVAYEIEKIISSYESYVESLTKEIEGKREGEVAPEICSLHNNRGYLDGLKRALEIVKSGGTAVGQKGDCE